MLLENGNILSMHDFSWNLRKILFLWKTKASFDHPIINLIARCVTERGNDDMHYTVKIEDVTLDNQDLFLYCLTKSIIEILLYFTGIFNSYTGVPLALV